jgi:hypothetical protein
MSATKHTAEMSCGVPNPYTRAYRRELGSEGIPNSQDGRKTDARVNGHLVQCIRTCTIRQQENLVRARCWASALNLEQAQWLEVRASEFLLLAAPMVGQLVDYTQNTYKHAVQAMVIHLGLIESRLHVSKIQQGHWSGRSMQVLEQKGHTGGSWLISPTMRPT